MKSPKKSLTFIELLISIAFLAVIVLAVNNVYLNFIKVAVSDIHRGLLYQDTSFAMEHIVKEVKKANYVIIDPADSHYPNYLKLGYLDTAKVKPEYYLDSVTKELRYCPDITKPATYEVLLTNVQEFTVKGKPQTSGTRFKGVQVIIRAKDPQNKQSFLQSAAFCRVPVTGLVRVVDSTRTIERGIYNTIKEAIGAKETIAGDIIQVSSNNRIAYRENVVINKSVTLEGRYNNRNWIRHLDDGTYETIVDGQQLDSVAEISGLSSGDQVTIDAFTIINGGGDGIDVRVANSNNITLTNNTITQNTRLRIDIANNSSTALINNIINYNTISGGDLIEISIDSSSVATLTKNSITNNTISGSRVTQDYIVSLRGQGTHNLINNMINDNTINGPSSIIQSYVVAMRGTTTNILVNNSISNNKIIGNVRISQSYVISIGGTSNTLINNSINHNTISGNDISQSYVVDINGTSNTLINNSISNNSVKENQITQSYAVHISGSGAINTALINNNIRNNEVSGARLIQSYAFAIRAGLRSNQTGTITLTNNDLFNNTIGATSGGQNYGLAISLSNSLYETNTTAILNLSNNIIRDNNEEVSIRSLGDAEARLSCTNNIFTDNDSELYISCGLGTTLLRTLTSINNTLANNGQVRLSASGGTLIVGNSIIFNNSSSSINPNNNISYSYVQNYSGGIGNISTGDPLFVNPAIGDYHLQGASPCRNKGNPDSQYNDPDGTRNDMGAYGGHGAASSIGTYTTSDNPSTPNIREDVIGTYGCIGAGCSG